MGLIWYLWEDIKSQCDFMYLRKMVWILLWTVYWDKINPYIMNQFIETNETMRYEELYMK